MSGERAGMDDCVDCDQAVSAMQIFLDGECGAVMQHTITLHLRECPSCLHRADFERHLRAFVAAKCREVAPRGLYDRVLHRLPLT